MGIFVPEELKLVRNSNLIFAYLYEDSPSEYFGSTAEMVHAFDNKIPILLVNERINVHPFHSYVSKYVKTNLDAGIRALKQLLDTKDEFCVDYIK